MKLTEAAIRNHEEMFPGQKSTLQQTDPELIEVFDNFAFDEITRKGEPEKVRLFRKRALQHSSQH